MARKINVAKGAAVPLINYWESWRPGVLDQKVNMARGATAGLTKYQGCSRPGILGQRVNVAEGAFVRPTKDQESSRLFTGVAEARRSGGPESSRGSPSSPRG